jgi:hypothetical protein
MIRVEGGSHQRSQPIKRYPRGFNSRAPIPRVGLLNQLKSVARARRMTRPGSYRVSIFPSPFRFLIMLVCKFLALKQYKYARKSCSSVVNCPAAPERSVNKTLAVEVKVLML